MKVLLESSTRQAVLDCTGAISLFAVISWEPDKFTELIGKMRSCQRIPRGTRCFFTIVDYGKNYPKPTELIIGLEIKLIANSAHVTNDLREIRVGCLVGPVGQILPSKEYQRRLKSRNGSKAYLTRTIYISILIVYPSAGDKERGNSYEKKNQ